MADDLPWAHCSTLDASQDGVERYRRDCPDALCAAAHAGQALRTAGSVQRRSSRAILRCPGFSTCQWLGSAGQLPSLPTFPARMPAPPLTSELGGETIDSPAIVLVQPGMSVRRQAGPRPASAADGVGSVADAPERPDPDRLVSPAVGSARRLAAARAIRAAPGGRHAGPPDGGRLGHAVGPMVRPARRTTPAHYRSADCSPSEFAAAAVVTIEWLPGPTPIVRAKPVLPAPPIETRIYDEPSVIDLGWFATPLASPRWPPARQLPRSAGVPPVVDLLNNSSIGLDMFRPATRRSGRAATSLAIDDLCCGHPAGAAGFVGPDGRGEPAGGAAA